MKKSTHLQEVFDLLTDDRTWLQVRWQMYTELFRTNAARLELLNNSGSTFFVDLRRVLIDDVILGVCRMIEPAGHGSRTNATLGRLALVSREEGDETLAGKLENALPEVTSETEALRKHRDKRIGHRDLNTVLKPEDNPLPGITADSIDHVLGLIGSFLNIYEDHFGEAITHFDWVNVSQGAEVLIHRLKYGEVFWQMYREDPLRWGSKRDESGFAGA